MEAEKQPPHQLLNWKSVSPYLETLVLIAILSYARWTAAGLLEDRARYTLFFVAPCYAVWRGGLVPGTLALIVTCYIGTFFFLPPDRQQAIQEPGDLLGLVLYVAVGLTIILLGEAQRMERRRVLLRDRELEVAHKRLAEANAKLAEANESLKEMVDRRTAQLEELRNWAADDM